MMVDLYSANCLDVLPKIESYSVDAVITDPPYPCIKRDYGYWTAKEWWELIVEGVVPEVRRILKPKGSAVFILQPNSQRVGKMRGWLWEFMAWVCKEWNLVQDVWWWNYTTIPCGGAISADLLRSSIKACVWMGAEDCYRNQSMVLWAESDWTKLARHNWRILNRQAPSGHFSGPSTMAAIDKRDGVTPFNLLMFSNGGRNDHPGSYGHSAGTPLEVADWWTRYIVPPNGVACDPFIGSGTMGIAAVKNGCSIIGIDKEHRYIETAKERIENAKQEMVQTHFI